MPTAFAISPTLMASYPLVENSSHCQDFFKTMETKSLAQTNGVHNYFNAFHRLISPVVLSLTVIVSRSRIYANLLTSVNGLNKKISTSCDGVLPVFPCILRESPCFVRESLATECGSCAII